MTGPRSPWDRKYRILLVEDDPGDVVLIRRALARTHFEGELFVVGDGVAALEFLHRMPPYNEVPRPDLVLLDLNLPRLEGREVLREVKTDLHLRRIAVVVLTTSDTEQDVLDSYDRHANCYLTKPVRVDALVHMVERLQVFWLQTATLPPR